MPRLRAPGDRDPSANDVADDLAQAGKSARTDGLSVQRKPASGSTPPQLGFTPPRADAADPFALHVQMKKGKDREDHANELIDGLTDAERGKLQVVTAGSKKFPPLKFSKDEMTDWADPGTHEGQSGAKITFGSNIDAAFHGLLTNIVGKITVGTGAQPLQPNTSMTLQVDLRAQKGPLGTFRFTYVDRKKDDAILVELVGTSTVEGLSATKTKDAEKKFNDNGFTQSGYSGKQLAALQQAVFFVPDAALALVKGVKFKRDSVHPTNPVAGGEYDEGKHTITMYDKAFQLAVDGVGTRDLDQFAARNVGHDGEVTDESARLIAHEIGHAIDYAPVKKAGKGPRASEADNKKVTDEFLDAVAKDGKAITEYGATAKGEAYAEAFSFFVMDPDLLKSLRPNVHAYFAKQFP